MTITAAAWPPMAHAQGTAPGGAGSAAPVAAQAPTVYRCPGPPVLYTDTLTPQEAKARNCKALAGLPVAVAPAAVPKTVAAPAKPPVLAPEGGAEKGATSPAGSVSSQATGLGAGSAVAADARVRPDDQRSRDAEARRILEAELRREEARLSEALRASGGAAPSARPAADPAQIRRAESDIEAIRRELGRLR